MIASVVRRFNVRWLAFVAAIALVSATAGITTALLSGEDSSPLVLHFSSEDAAGADADLNGAGPGPLDPAIEFPSALEDLPGVNDLAVDPSTGDLWFLLFTYDGVSNTLHHYSPGSGALETFDIPSSTGSELFSAIGFSPAGRLILAEGTVVTEFDPGAGTYEQTGLAKPATPAAPYFTGHGSYILDMAIADDEVIYLSRMNIAAVTRLDLSTGASREFPYPEGFGPAESVTIAGDQIWIASRSGVVGVTTPQTGRIDSGTGAFSSVGPGTTALVTGPSGAVRGIRSGSPEAPEANLVDVRDTRLAPLEFASESDKSRAVSGLGILDYMAIDSASGAIWFAGSGSRSIFRVDSQSGELREYLLPVYEVSAMSCPPPDLGGGPSCPSGVKMNTLIRGLAVAPNGDVYFSDATMNRIGVIHAGS